MAEVTAHHRLQVALCHQHLLWDKDDPNPRQRIWIKNGDTNHLRNDEQAWPRIAQTLADIEAEARSAATQSGGAWVKCRERMPESRQRVWFALYGGGPRDGVFARNQHGAFFCGEHGDFSESIVFCWMPQPPIPAAPKGDTDG